MGSTEDERRGRPDEEPPDDYADLQTVDVSESRPDIVVADGVTLIVYHRSGSRVVELDEPSSVVVGRGAGADIVIDDRSLSREHARFVYRARQLWVEDLQSRNGTKVNGRRVAEASLRSDDEITMGAVVACVFARRGEPRLVDSAEGDPLVLADSMRELFGTIELVADADVPVLILGETGVGKELVARAVHRRSSRRDAPMRAVNCGAIARELTESLLFGHERGAFTGAAQRSKGLFEEADGGTLLLDEIGELPAGAQAALLRVLETGRIMRVGTARETPVDVRVIAATHRDLEAMCKRGEFRSDLLYRLNTITLEVPPLRERPEEIVPLAERFAGGALSADVAAALAAYDWPGNIRELRNVVRRAAILARGGPMSMALLPPRLREGESASGGDQISEDVSEPRVVLAPSPVAAPPAPTPAPAPNELPVIGDLRHSTERLEVALLELALARTRGNQSEAARLLGIPQRTMSNKVSRFQLGEGPSPGARQGAAAALERYARDLLEAAGQLDLRQTLQRYERSVIAAALDEHRTRAAAAEALGLPLRTLSHKIRAYDID